MAKRMTMLLTLFSFILAIQSNLSSAKTTDREQIACTMCESCANPCQPQPSPPPPPPEVICPPPPPPPSPPPPTAIPGCPPPPAPPTCSECSIPVPQLSPPGMPLPFPPPSGEFAPPDRVPYFPNYYNPPPSEFSNSPKLRLKSIMSSALLLLTLVCCF